MVQVQYPRDRGRAGRHPSRLHRDVSFDEAIAMSDTSFAKKLKLAMAKLVELPVQYGCILSAAVAMPGVVTFVQSS